MRKSIKKLFKRPRPEERSKLEATDETRSSSSSRIPTERGEQANADHSGHNVGTVHPHFSSEKERSDANSPSTDLRQPELGRPTSQSLSLVPAGIRNVYCPDAVTEARAALWEKAYKALQAEKPDLILNFESIIKDDTNLSQDLDLFSSAAIAKVVATQQQRMENKQWTIHWFDKKVNVRDTIESILSTIKTVSPIIAAGMDCAPPFVSIPWSFVSIALPFITREFSEMHAAIDGLKYVACILSSYNTAEQEFLANSVTRNGFQEEVLNLYTKILEYQALAAQHFAVSTIQRLGRNIYPGSTWQDALSEVKRAEGLCHIPINGLAIRLQQTSFRSLEDLLNQNTILMKSRKDQSFVRRTQNEQVIEWISKMNAVQDHTEIRRRLGDDYFGSGQWLLRDNKDFQSWLENSSTMLLLQGVVGTGKSSLVSMVLEHLMARADGLLAFNYCSATASSLDPINTIRNDTTNIFRSILSQCALLPNGNIAEPLLEAFRKSHNQGPGQSELSLGATLQLLREVLSSRDDQVTMVFDALDELSDYETFLESLCAVHIPGKKLRIFFSSRYGIDIMSVFPETVKLPIASQTTTDLSRFVGNEIQKRWNRSGITDSQAVRLEKALTKWSEGVFRWVALELEIFLPPARPQGSRVRPADFEARLRKLERSRAPAVDRLFLAYDQIYQDALGEEDEISRRRIVNTTMKWILCTFRPFNVTELISVVSCSLVVSQERFDDIKDGNDSSSIGLAGEYSDLDPVSEDDLFAYCANFITATKEGIVRLAHLSVRQYFEEVRSEDFQPEQQNLEAALLSIRTISGHAKGRISSSLVDYFSKLWPIHARFAATSSELDLLLSSNQVLKHLEVDDIKLKIALRDDLQGRDCLGNTILHDAILSGSREDVELILQVHALFQQTSPLSKERNSSGDTPLHVAASRGIECIFTALIHAGAGVTQQNEFGLTPLHVAVIFGQEDIIRSASQFSCDLDVQDVSGSTPLHFAAFCNAVDIGRILISSGMSIRQQDCQNRSARDIAKESGNWDFAAMLKSFSTGETTASSDLRLTSQGQWTARPRIQLESTLACAYCHIEEWLEGSRQGLRYPHCPSLSALEDSSETCSLCRYFCTSVRKLASAQGAVSSFGAESTEIAVGVSLAADSNDGTTSQDLLSVYYGSGLAGQLEICVNNDDLLTIADLSFLVGRATHGFEKSMEIAKGWLKSCRETHLNCSIKSRPPPSARLIEISDKEGPCALRLVHCRNIEPDQCRYACLSFTWGEPIYIPVTRHDNIVRRSEIGFSLEEMPQLFRDVIAVCRSLGCSYLFIDALCIVQDSNDEKQQQIPTMDGIISAAEFVIASTGSSVQDRLLGNQRSADHVTRLRARLSSSEDSFSLFLREPFPTSSDVMYKTVLDRTWRAQEALLAGRLLFFNSDHAMWNCATFLRTEASARTQAPVYKNLPHLHYAVSEHFPGIEENPQSSKQYLYSEWYRYVEMISSGKLTYVDHLLPATVAVAQAVNSIVSTISSETTEEVENHYHQGIRADDIHRSLLWINKNAMEYKDYLSSGPEIASWSWASRAGWKSYRLVSSVPPYQDATSTDLQILRIDKGDIATWPTIWRIGGDELFRPRLMRVKAQVRLLSSNETLRMYDLLFDTSDFRRSWRSGQGFLFMVVTRWAYSTSKLGHRWIGLILQRTAHSHQFGGGESEDEKLCDPTKDEELETRGFPERYVRAGLFLGPKCDDGLEDWSSQTISLV